MERGTCLWSGQKSKQFAPIDSARLRINNILRIYERFIFNLALWIRILQNLIGVKKSYLFVIFVYHGGLYTGCWVPRVVCLLSESIHLWSHVHSQSPHLALSANDSGSLV